MKIRSRSNVQGPASVPFEQAVYGSFAFRDEGYGVLGRSPGCADAWLAEFRAACQAIGERPAEAAEAPGLFATRLPSGVWAVVGMSPQGRDDRGRPGAVAFHSLFFSPKAYRDAGANPFVMAPALRSDWSAADADLPAGMLTVGPAPAAPAECPRAAKIVDALTRGRRVLIESPAPIDALAADVWRRLPARTRARATVATWAFGNAHRFDLIAVPRRAGVEVDATYVSVDEGAPSPGGTNPTTRWRWPALGLGALLGLAAVGLALRGSGDEGPPLPDASPIAAAPPPAAPDWPRRGDFPAGPDDDDPAERARVVERLVDLADRCGLGPVPGGEGPAELMGRLSRGLRYRGPLLDDAQRASLAAESHRDAPLALEWDRLARGRAVDRPLPPDFAEGPLRWQLGALAWSLNVEEGDAEGRRASPAEVARGLAESLSVDVPLRPTLLAGRYPPLSAYLAFLGRLPRR